MGCIKLSSNSKTVYFFTAEGLRFSIKLLTVKSLSSPNSFEGFGERARAWLKEIENQYSLPRKQRLKIWVKKTPYLLYS